MANSDNSDALAAGLAWLPWSEDPSAECPAVVVQFFESLEIDVSVALSRSSRKTALSEWLKCRFGQSHQEPVRWFEVGVHTMIASGMFASGAPPDVTEDAMTAYQAVLEEAGISLKARDRIATLVRGLALTPLDQRIFARLLEMIGARARAQSASAFPGPNVQSRAATSYFVTVAVVIAVTLVGLSRGAPPFALPLLLLAGFLLTTALGCLGAFRD